MLSQHAVDDRPGALAPVALPSDILTDRSRPQCGMSYIAFRLDGDWKTIAIPRLVTRIRGLIRSWAFPPPSTPRIYKGEWLWGIDAVGTRARWDKALVDRWFAAKMPPELILAVDNDELELAADALDANAAAIGARR
jgi:hypothetical protein